MADSTVYEGFTGRIVGLLYALVFGGVGAVLIWWVVSRNLSTAALVFGVPIGLVFVGSGLYAVYRVLTEEEFSVRVRSGSGGS